MDGASLSEVMVSHLDSMPHGFRASNEALGLERVFTYTWPLHTFEGLQMTTNPLDIAHASARGTTEVGSHPPTRSRC